MSRRPSSSRERFLRIARDLVRQLRELQEALEGLGTTVDEDKPGRGDVVVASILSDAVLAASGFLEEEVTSLQVGKQVVREAAPGQHAGHKTPLTKAEVPVGTTVFVVGG